MTPLALMAIASAAATNTVAEADSLYGFESMLNEIVVTGTRAPKLLKDTPVQTMLITSKEIERSDATDIQDLLLQQMPGVEFTYAMNQQTHFNIGGFGGQGVLFLVDGERLAGETMDDVDFSRIAMNGVERIEIVRGASSALYGSNAAGGIINIITKEGRKNWGVDVSGRYGRHNEQRYTLSARAKGKHVRNNLDASFSRIDTYDVHSAPDPATRVVTSIYGNKVWDIRDRLTVSPVDGLDISARAGFYFKEIPRIIDTPERYRDFTGGLKADWIISAADRLEVSYSFDQYDKSSYMMLTGTDVKNYRDVLNTVRGVYNHTFGRGDVLTLGADYRYDWLDNTKIENGAKHESNTDVFAQYDWNIDHKWEVVGAVRYDYFSSGNLSRVTPKLSARYKIHDNMNLRLAYGMGFRTPTLKERYYNFDMAGIWIVVGNPYLRPETSHNVNASFDWTKGAYNATATAYYNNVENKIATGLPYYQPGDSRQLYLDYLNLADYSVAGFDITLQGRWNNGLSAKISYAFTHENFPKDKDGNTANNQYIPMREHTLTAHADWTRNFTDDYSLTVGINGRVLSGVTNREYKDYYDISKGTTDVHYPAYTMWKLSVSQTFWDTVKLTLSADNLFNYRPKYYYLNAPLTDGIFLRAGMSVSL